MPKKVINIETTGVYSRANPLYVVCIHAFFLTSNTFISNTKLRLAYFETNIGKDLELDYEAFAK